MKITTFASNLNNCQLIRESMTMNRLYLLFVFFLLVPVVSFSQLDAGVDDTINPGVPVTLSATYGLIGNGVTISDDGVEGPYPVGFDFSFFGNSYNQFYIGANGWISFSPNPNAQGTRQAFAVPSPADFNPKNCILGPFEDLNPLQAGSPYIFYQTIGEAPDRKLLVMWCETPMYGCLNDAVTFQIILCEGTNLIENHLYKKPLCADWLEGKATLGLQNSTGYIGIAAPGRNARQWSAEEEAWQFVPSSVDSFKVYQIDYNMYPMTPGSKISWKWYREGELISEQQECVVAPSVTTTYVAWVQVCSGQVFTDTVTVHVIPYIPNAFSPNGDGLNDIFRVIGLPPENITRYNMEIYNRWGERIYQSESISAGWDGTTNGSPCPAAAYIWVIYYEDDSRNVVSNKGVVTLVR